MSARGWVRPGLFGGAIRWNAGKRLGRGLLCFVTGDSCPSHSGASGTPLIGSATVLQRPNPRSMI